MNPDQLCLLQPLSAASADDTYANTVSTVGVVGIVTMAAAVAILSTLATFLAVRAWRKRHNMTLFDDKCESMVSGSSPLSSIMFRTGTIRSDCPADTMSNPTINYKPPGGATKGRVNEAF